MTRLLGFNRRGTALAAAAVLAGAAAAAAGALILTGGGGNGRLPLRLAADVRLPGGSSRFDYQSIDLGRERLFIAHLGGGSIVVFDLRRRVVAATIGGVPGVHGVLVVPAIDRLLATATSAHDLVIFDERTGRKLASANAGVYPDGIAYDPADHEVFSSDEAGEFEAIVDVRSGRRLALLRVPGEAGNVQYETVSRYVLVAVGEVNEIAVIDPRHRRIVREIPLPGCANPHGLRLDSARRLAFVACDANDKLLTLDLTSDRVVQIQSVGDRLDVLDFDPVNRRLYVAAESGVVAVFREHGRRLSKLGQGLLADEAHSVAVDPHTHLVYFPLEDVAGRPVLRIMRPTGR